MSDVVEVLRKIEALKPGDMVPPEIYDESGNWATLMSKLCGDAANEIDRLRAQVADLTRIAGCVAVAGAVEVPVKTFDDIKREINASRGKQPVLLDEKGTDNA